MLSICRRAKGTAGFSLVEVLVAVAIAAALSTVLVRFIGNARTNAASIEDRLNMAILSGNLLEELPIQKIRAGRIDGHTGRFLWRIDIVPVGFGVRALKMSTANKPKKKDDQAANPLGISAPIAAAPSPAATKANFEAKWVPFRVAVYVQSAAGRSYRIETIKIGREGPNEE